MRYAKKIIKANRQDYILNFGKNNLETVNRTPAVTSRTASHLWTALLRNARLVYRLGCSVLWWRGLNYVRIEGGYLLQLKLLIVQLKGNSLTGGSGFETWSTFVSARYHKLTLPTCNLEIISFLMFKSIA